MTASPVLRAPFGGVSQRVLYWFSKHETFAAVVVLSLILNICFFPFLWGNATLLAGSRGVGSVMPDGAWYGQKQGPAISRGNDMGAASWVMEASAPLVGYQYREEKALPLWNPYQKYGAPLAANMQSQPFQPLYVLFAMNPGPRTYAFFILARLLIAGLCAYWYLRLFLGFAPSLAGGIAFMLSGYFILFLNMPHISVEMLVPAVFLAVELLLRDQSARNVLLGVSVTFLCVVGGMPESTFLALLFGLGYFLFRVTTDRGLRATAWNHVKHYILVSLIGIALAGFLLMPFLEFMRLSYDVHQPRNFTGELQGLRHDTSCVSLCSYLVPALFGPTWSSVAPTLGGYTFLRGFIGIVQFLFVVVAAGSLLSRREKTSRSEQRIIMFFAVSAVIILLKRYGSPLIQWIGSVPLFRLVYFAKYEEPLLAFAFAALCAFGMSQVLGQAVSRRRLAMSVLIAGAALIATAAVSLGAVRAAKADGRMTDLSLAGAAAMLALSGIALWIQTNADSKKARGNWLAPVLIVILTAEMGGNYLLPVYYILTRSATADTNPYRGAPYVEFLKANNPDHDRVMGRDGILYPDWAGAFQISDVRGVDAMYYQKYFRFLRAFLTDSRITVPDKDLINRFIGTGGYNLETGPGRKFRQLSSVRYLLSKTPYPHDSGVAQEVVRQNRGRLATGSDNRIDLRAFSIAGETKAVLYEHPVYERLPFQFEVTPTRQRFIFSIGIDPAVYAGPGPVCGDGVEFRLEIRSGGRIDPLYARYIDPKHNLPERKWITESVDLSRYSGQTVELLFTTTPGPVGDTCMDWAGWGDPHFDGDSSERTQFRQIYDREIKIYEDPDVLPRAALFSDVEIASDDEAALGRLVSPTLDVSRTAVISAGGLSAADRAVVQRMHEAAGERVQRARILAYRSQRVDIEANSGHSTLLVLNDSDYPGWKVYVDGQASKWITANYLFRGVFLKPGRHMVRFAYEPASSTGGAAVAGAGLLGLAGLMASKRRRAKADTRT